MLTIVTTLYKELEFNRSDSVEPGPITIAHRLYLLSFRCELSNAQQYDIKNLYVFTDLCECSYVRDQYLPLLTNIYLNDDNTVVRKVAETFHAAWSSKDSVVTLNETDQDRIVYHNSSVPPGHCQIPSQRYLHGMQ